MEESSEAIVEERQELMVSPMGENPTLRIAYFLKPTSKDIEYSTFELLPNTLLPETASPVLKPENIPLEAAFNGWLGPQKDWITWEEKLHARYHNLWKKAGILEAIKASTFRLLKDQKLLLGLAQKWYPKTSTFIFPWGEATITLEDMMVLGGYSVLGAPVFTPLEAKEQRDKEGKLIEARRKFTTSRAKRASHYQWMRYFMENDSYLEHEAFLSLWLCRFVFPNVRGAISEHVFPIAILLASGIRIALAPAVLASIYRDLSLLNKDLNAAIKWRSGVDHEDGIAVSLWAPFQLVQVWALERFSSMQPTPKELRPNQPILSKWHEVKTLKNDNVGLALDNAGNCFQWRPYTCSQFFKFYSRNANWVCLNSDSSDDEMQSFAFCLRPCELVGIECIEQYLPHRVAMQFGLDQDIPASVPRRKRTSLVAWRNYSKPVNGAKLYIASFITMPCVTSQYLQWWKQSKIGPGSAGKDSELQQASAPPGLELGLESKRTSERKKNEDYSVLHEEQAMDVVDQEDQLTTTEVLEVHGSSRSIGKSDASFSTQPTTYPSPIAAENFAETENVARESERTKQVAEADHKEAGGSRLSGREDASDEARMRSPLICGASDDEEDNRAWLRDLEIIAELEARVEKVEKVFAELKKEILGHQD